MRRYDCQRSSSFLRRMKRRKFIPIVTLFEVLKFRVENGIAIVAVHPSAVLRALDFQMPSQLGSLTRPSSEISASNCVPSALVVKVYPLRLSLFGEIRTVKLSSTLKSASRRNSVATIFFDSESKQCIPKYR